MSSKVLGNCSQCGFEDKWKKLIRLNGGWICKPCHRERKKEHREYLKRDVLGIRKIEDVRKEAEEKRKEKKNFVPFIKGSKEKNPYVGIYITRTEKDIIFRKYSHLGWDYAEKKVEEIVKHLNNLKQKWKDEKLEREEVNIRFKEEFAKLINRE